MPHPGPIPIDVLIIGGGCAGLWITHRLTADGHRCLLLEGNALGTGQTIAAQGIIHGGMKYSLAGLVSASARAIREMPERWRRSLSGSDAPDLTGVTMRTEICHLWQTTSLRSRVGMLGAKAGLRVAPITLSRDDRPDPLRSCPGTVARLDEPVVDPASLLEELAAPLNPLLLQVDPAATTFTGESPVSQCTIASPAGDTLTVAPRVIVLAAGAGNDALRQQCGLAPIMQRRPLHMVVVRGVLPSLNGHCVDGAATRVTITSAADADGTTVWQVGGQIAERGVDMDEHDLIRHASNELADVLPDVGLDQATWTTYRVDRAEPGTRAGHRPDDAFALLEGNVITAWPTKMALAPRLADRVAELVGTPDPIESDASRLATWPRPIVATPPWETA